MMMRRLVRQPRWEHTLRAAGCSFFVVVVLGALTGGCAGGSSSEWSGEPWAADAVMPADLVKELSGSEADRPQVVCTAPAVLYRVGHIPGAVLHGPGVSPGAIASLTAWAQPLPRSTKIVIYCGCCPIRECPNLNLPYQTLKNLGFTNVRVLVLGDSFRVDWVDRGYPIGR